MRKEDAILKINKLGNVGNIIVRIMKVLVILGFALMLAGAIAVMALPKNLIKMDLGSTANITVDASEFGTPDEQGRDDMLQGFLAGMDEEDNGSVSVNGSIIINGSEYEPVKVETTDTGMRVEAEVDTYSIELSDFGIVCVLGMITLAAVFVSLLFAGKLCVAFRDCESPFEENVVKQLHALAYSLIPWVILGSLTESVAESIFTNNWNIMIGIDLGMALIIIFIFVLAYIFKYGAVLQQESDETL